MTQGTTCEEHGFFDIVDNAECNAAAATLGLDDTTVCGTCPASSGNFPNG